MTVTIDLAVLLVAVLILTLALGTVLLVIWQRRQESRRALQERIKELQGLSDAVTAIASANQLDEDGLCALAFEQTRKLADATLFQIGLFRDNDYDIRFRTLNGVEQPPAQFPLDAPGIIKWVRDTGQHLLVRDFTAEMSSLPARPSYIVNHPPRSAVFVPMRSGEHVIGAMALQSLLPFAFTDAHLRTLIIIANQTASAIDNARALGRERNRTKQLELVSEVARQTQAALTPNQLVGQLTRAVGDTFGYYSVLICLLEGDDGGIVCMGHMLPDQIAIRTRTGVGLVGQCVERNTMIVVDDVTADKRYLPVTALPDTRSEAALPLTIDGKVIGVLDLQSRTRAAFSGDDRRYLEVLAQQVAVAVEEARLYELALSNQRLGNELSLARDIQTSFLPRYAPQVPGWDLAASWQSATQVGGDFYDFIPLRRAAGTLVSASDGGEDGSAGDHGSPITLQITPRGTRVIQHRAQSEPESAVLPANSLADKYGIVIADVAGKGVPAAIFMALARTLMRAVAFTGRPPAEALKRVNELIHADTRSDLFVTLLFSHWEPATGIIEFANAGHNPPIHIKNDGTLRVLSMPGMALGVIEEIAPKVSQMTLERGESLVFYTDGITDALNAQGEDFGMNRLKFACDNARALSAQGILAGIVDAVADFASGETPTDDQTLVVLKREGP